jgi:hypothetical protein
MFKRRTVFVIGAGASAEFNMPVGSDLIARVAAAVNVGAHGQTNDQNLAVRIRGHFGQDHAERLLRSGPELAAVATQFASMDEALHFLSDASDIVELGKLAISHEMMKAERNSHLYAAQHGSEPGTSRSNNSWAGTFLRIALAGSRRQDLPCIFENVTIIDFNYDRVLPQFLYWALKQNLHIAPTIAAQSVRNLKILHPYGSLGNLEWLDETGSLPFGADHERLDEIAGRIRTYTEEVENPDIAQIQDAVAQGSLFVVIGFGFHRQNIKIMSPTNIPHRPNVKMLMTVLGIPEGNRPAIQREMQDAFRAKEEPEIFAIDGSGMLQALRSSISLAATQ